MEKSERETKALIILISVFAASITIASVLANKLSTCSGYLSQPVYWHTPSPCCDRHHK